MDVPYPLKSQQIGLEELISITDTNLDLQGISSIQTESYSSVPKVNMRQSEILKYTERPDQFVLTGIGRNLEIIVSVPLHTN